MKFHPKPASERGGPDDSLFDVDALAAQDDLPDALPEDPKAPSRLQKMGDRGLQTARTMDPRVTADRTLLVLILLANTGFLLFNVLALILPNTPDFRLALISALVGLLSGIALVWPTFSGGRDTVYTRVYLFFFLSAFLGLLGFVPMTALGMILAPALFGYGFGTYCAIVARLLFRSKNRRSSVEVAA